MDQTIITNEIEITPDKLDCNIKDHIIEQIKGKIGTCSKKHGYILDIVEIKNIVNKSISNTSSNIVFKVDYNAKILKPDIDKVVKCKVNMIFTQGIFAGINKMNILIPEDQLINYTFNHKDNTYYNGKKVIKKGDEIDIVIKNVKYMKKQYSCIGVLKE